MSPYLKVGRLLHCFVDLIHIIRDGTGDVGTVTKRLMSVWSMIATGISIIMEMVDGIPATNSIGLVLSVISQ